MGGGAEDRMTEELAAIGAAFEIPGRFAGASLLKVGHIHDTFAASYQEGERRQRYVHQRLNGRVFPDLEALMENLVRITRHQWEGLMRAGALDAERRCLRLVGARAGRAFHVDEEGGTWRTFHFLEGVRTRDTIAEPEQAYQVARAFGSFAASLRDLPGPPLAVTIPRFHDLAARFAAFDEAVAADSQRRAASVSGDIDRAAARFQGLTRLLAERGFADLPRRIAHNDCKIDNAMLDLETGEGLCVIDLDTVMEGTLLCDFGELVRTGTSRSPEDEVDLASIRFELDLFRAATRGYLEGAASLLAEEEIAVLPLAGPVMALENAIRFLTDHLRGDLYFRIHREGQNLDRFRAQLRLVEQMSERLEEMEEIVEEAWRERGARAGGWAEK
jgi:hypothetical protein